MVAKQRKKLPARVAESQMETTQIERATRDYQEEIARLAYSLWQARGCADGFAEEDWFRAEREIEARVRTGEKKMMANQQTSRPFLV
jgi:hypothetical protein